ncbi:hypothetical protein CYMTET_11069 [Cymbomonas tetramitiformis]|uniref:Uncharacterized protein n=1 Tax=Cymbomonas tetramitiformis TaxID=36881 RepID=A0AAE0GN15_9CHLO|nr:hypothetical protein CYMTET_11069 [Cymbomonas tetramitiformis]
MDGVACVIACVTVSFSFPQTFVKPKQNIADIFAHLIAAEYLQCTRAAPLTLASEVVELESSRGVRAVWPSRCEFKHISALESEI